MKNNKNKKGIIYCRVSSKEQVQGTSLGSQEKLCRDYATRENIQLAKVFIEKGESAKTADRTEFKKALTYCSEKKNDIEYFIVYKLDRFSRNQHDHVTIKALLQKIKVKIRSATEPIDDNPIGQALEGMLSVFAEFDNNVRTERSKQGMIEKIKKGVWQWMPPLGYYRPVKGGNIAPEPHNIHLIKQVFKEYSSGTYTYKSLAEFMHIKGLRTTTSKKPTPQIIEKMIKNPIYCGIIKCNFGTFEGSFKPIISKQLFNDCQKVTNGSVHANPRSANNPMFPLRKVITCSECNTPLTGSASTGRHGKKYPYYHHTRSGCSKNKSIAKENFEQLFVELLNDITPSPEYEELFKAVVIDIWQSNYKLLNKSNERIRKEIKQLEEDRQKVFEFHRTKQYTDEEFKEQKNILNGMIDEKNLLLQENNLDGLNMEKALDDCFEFVRTTSKTWIELEYQDKLKFQNIIFTDRIKFDGEKLGTPDLSLIYKLNKENITQKSQLVPPPGIEPRSSA